ncbi:ATP-binding cassette domain-containing protein [Streptomyces sp. TLI_185]|uniref:ATP-binding cassette domain-containing protein n=1 Tax=Streptomyces sp. TLI_185 TaxID=2485151 RepID=UPI000F948BD8|nr:ATP-binding cassette domain-containing protein [Streptomyces sp. TLI_185]RPF38800.1 ATP-binding cassette subfamily C protein [Streptomyces sp. TLI_185]
MNNRVVARRGAVPVGGIGARGLRFLRDRRRVVVRLGGWSVLETGQTFVTGYAPARALDAGFLAGRAGVGLAWLGVAGLGVVVGAYGTGRVYAAVAALVEPLRDRLVEGVVGRGVREADGGALSGLTQQVEIARDTFAGLVMVSRSFVFTAVGAFVGLVSLAPLLLLVVGPPLVAGVALFAMSLRPLARRQEAFLVADEALADRLGAVCPGLRDITATGAEERIAADTGELVDAELRAARSLARWGVLRIASLAVGGQLPLVLLLAAGPWLLSRGVTTGALVGALAYITQSLLPALRNLVHGLGTSGSRLTVVLRRLSTPPHRPSTDRPHPERTATDSHNDRPASPLSRPAPTDQPRPSAPADDRPRKPLPAFDWHGEPPTPAPPHSPPDDDTAAAPATPDDHPRDRLAPPDRQEGGHPTTASHQSTPTRTPTTQATPALSLTSVTFAYGPTATPVIENLDLVLPPGSHLAVVGPSGIGKSTLTALVAGLLEPRRGTIRVGGEPVPSAAAARRRVLIPQEAYVFTGTVAENLAHFRQDPVPEAELLAAADVLGLGPLVDALGGPGAQVDPAALSAGERQLIALARAYLSHAPLALLDEATCHLDPQAEERAERAFAQRPGGTLVVVAHRISSARRADRVLVMDGRGTACGTHHELLETSPLYRELVGSWTPVPSQPALPLRDADRVDAVAGPGLAGDGRHVVAHGPVGQVEAPGDLRHGGTLGGQG